MTKGQLHSTGTICRAEKLCPLEKDGGQHFDTADQLVEYTASDTGVKASEIREVISTGVSISEAVSMARDGVLGGGALDSSSRVPENSATITIDLSSATSDTLKTKFLENLGEMYPVSSVKTDGMGSYTVVVDADSDPDDYSVRMAASVAVNNAATAMGYDEEELENLDESLSIDVDPIRKNSPSKIEEKAVMTDEANSSE